MLRMVCCVMIPLFVCKWISGFVFRRDPAFERAFWPAAKNRFTPWKDLPEHVNEAASEELLYTELTWNQPGTNQFELLSFSELDSDRQMGILAIGLDEEAWDCWVNHYADYYWWELDAKGVAECYEALGWEESNWEESNWEESNWESPNWEESNWESPDSALPSSESKYWSDLTSKEKDAARCLCYFEDNWNEEACLDEYDVAIEDLLL